MVYNLISSPSTAFICDTEMDIIWILFTSYPSLLSRKATDTHAKDKKQTSNNSNVYCFRSRVHMKQGKLKICLSKSLGNPHQAQFEPN